jgi:TonB family protein
MSKKRYPLTFLALALSLSFVTSAAAQDRKLKEQVSPQYPEMAKSMHIAGSVKVQVTIEPNGSVKETKVIGGHPLLADAAVRAISKWKYEPGAEETKVVQVDFKNGN